MNVLRPVTNRRVESSAVMDLSVHRFSGSDIISRLRSTNAAQRAIKSNGAQGSTNLS